MLRRISGKFVLTIMFFLEHRLLLRKKSSFKKGSTYHYSGRTKNEIAQVAQRVRRPNEYENDPTHLQPYNENTNLSSSVSNASSGSKYRSDDDASYSFQSDASSQNKEYDKVSEHAAGNNIPSIYHYEGKESEAVENEDEVSKEVYPSVDSDNLFSEKAFPKIGLLDKLKMSNGEDESSDTNIPITNSQLEDETDLGLDTFKTQDFSLEVESMFQKINSEYGGSPTGWQYNLTSITPSEHEDDAKEEGSETEDNLQNPSSEFTEVDANQVLVDLTQNEFKNSDKTEADNQSDLCNESETVDNQIVCDEAGDRQKKYSDKTEADEETEMQLKQRVRELYMPSHHATVSYDSDSDASAMTVDDESSAFEDDGSLPASSTSSVTSLPNREGYLNQIRKLKLNGDIYNLAKEMLLTERTLVKDLEVLTVSFRNVIEKDRIISDKLMKLLYDNLDPLYDYHCSLLAELEERLTLWEMGTPSEAQQCNVQKIGDIMHRNMRQMKLNVQYIKKHEDILLALEAESASSKKFAKVYKEFELGSVCYLSLNSFLLKPVQRLLYYRNMLERLTKEYGNQHPDAIDAKVAFEEVTEACREVKECRESLGNLHKLVELQRDLVGLKDLVHPKRKFIREGCLHKICRKGPQPRMFFLLSDILLYTSQGVTSTNQFRARAAVPLRDIKLENGGVELHSLYAFTIVGPGDKSFIAAASSPEEKAKWMEDIQNAINDAVLESFCDACKANKSEHILNVGGNNGYMCPDCKAEITKLENLCPKERLSYWKKYHPPPVTISQNTTEGDSDDEGSYSVTEQFSTLEKQHAHSRTISTRKVCWHRNASISMREYTLSIENSLSGILRRKYKNTTRWQKLWVVFTNFCLYFFKNYEEESPFASLPLIGYVVSAPTESEVHEELAIKLQFKTHVYIFRADKEYNFKRWMEVLTIAAKNSSKRPRLTSRMTGRLVPTS